MLSTWLESEKSIIDERLADSLPAVTSWPSPLHEAMRYAVLAGGKRLRPILCREACRVLGGDPDQANWPAMAIEILHTYTLVHDDLPCMDDDALRRGQPTVHIKYGEAQAVLCGDALLTLAFEWIAKANHIGMVSELASSTGSQGVIGGQIEDLLAENNASDAQGLERIHLNKTAKLLQASLKIGGMAAGGSPSDLDALDHFGKQIGLAFQIMDDILDCTADEDELGKPVGSDEEQNKTTYVSLYGIEAARKQATELIQSAKQSLAGYGENAKHLQDLADYILQRRS